MWERFLHSLVLEWTESDLWKINWFRGVIRLHSWCLREGFHFVTFLSNLFWIYEIISQSWMWVAWPRNHEVRITKYLTWLQNIFWKLPSWSFPRLLYFPSSFLTFSLWSFLIYSVNVFFSLKILFFTPNHRFSNPSRWKG